MDITQSEVCTFSGTVHVEVRPSWITVSETGGGSRGASLGGTHSMHAYGRPSQNGLSLHHRSSSVHTSLFLPFPRFLHDRISSFYSLFSSDGERANKQTHKCYNMTMCRWSFLENSQCV
ncbi:hypothetical protein NQD34_012376 [Periophthalmus magnuspinnatus]|nr:hypothetical protein NQD34_012376 [Periophthalmus magnuspinnatus]